MDVIVFSGRAGELRGLRGYRVVPQRHCFVPQGRRDLAQAIQRGRVGFAVCLTKGIAHGRQMVARSGFEIIFFASRNGGGIGFERGLVKVIRRGGLYLDSNPARPFNKRAKVAMRRAGTPRNDTARFDREHGIASELRDEPAAFRIEDAWLAFRFGPLMSSH